MKPIFIIEHLEPKLWPWCIIEYTSISAIVGKNNVWFTNLNTQKLSNCGRVIKKPVSKLEIDFSQACILDPLAKDTLTPKAAKQYRYFIMGGILGEEKLNGRTKRELTAQFPQVHAYNLEIDQFSTDNAVYVTNKIIEGTPISKMPFKDTIEIRMNAIESVILPYRYPLVNGKPRISPELITYLKKKKGF
jgi:ribosome biogenesis SPOUT family RNA methylase Rps3